MGAKIREIIMSVGKGNTGWKQLAGDILLALGVLFLVSGIFLVFQFQTSRNYQEQEVSFSREDFTLEYPRPAGDVAVEIPEGSSTLEVAELLEDAGVVDGERFLDFIAYLDIEKSIRSGRFTFSTEDELDEVLQKITVRR
ncbi:MAG: hypothetical protein ACOCZM_00565 [Bacillota bacterium]